MLVGRQDTIPGLLTLGNPRAHISVRVGQSALESKYNRKQAADHNKILAASKADLTDSDRYVSPRITQNKKARNGVLSAHKHQGNKTPKNKGYQN